MRVVAALGGNALLRREETAEAAVLRANVATAATAIAELAAEHDVVVTHGNGPQIGLLALQSEALHVPSPYPLDVLGAESEGMIGYLLEQELYGRLGGRPIATLLTQVIVDADDPAFAAPTKPIGATYDEATARALAAERGWTIAPDGAGFRRVVPSPEPRAIVELETLRLLVERGVLTIAVGGGGIPVIAEPDGRLTGTEAVIDKDLAAALLALELSADALLLLTDVAGVQAGWGTPEARPLRAPRVGELRALSFASGSMGPKVEAACRFVAGSGGVAAIAELSSAAAALRGQSGTRVMPDP